jgi:valyl-tRNA synthetase
MNEGQLPTIYDPKSVEEKWIAVWDAKKYSSAQVVPGKPRFSITIPPPNVTGELHIGHALQHAIHDTLIRWQRMQGKETLCVPGTDHAGIGTQIKVEAQLATEGLTKHDIGREKFLDRMWEWKEHYGGTILRQLRRFGASYDWDRERFTMDAGYVKAVLTAFTHLYNKGLIYRGTRIVNWCPSCQTAISDLEVDHEDKQGNMWHFKYPLADGSGAIIVATTRPETMLGDTAVAVNPDDERYKNLIGQKVMLPLMNREIPIVGDAYVDMTFGTGAVKVTPAHDPNDAEIGMRHRLPAPIVIGKDGRMTEEAGEFAGMDRYDARKAIVTALNKLSLVTEIKDHFHAVGQCTRCKNTIEPLLSEQWYVKMEPLAKHALDVLKAGKIAYQPDRFIKYTEDWLENIRDWCISRQLWWGHRIPVFTCDDCGHEFASVETADKCPKCGGLLKQEDDVLDTWFSSALWPFAVLGWPDKTPELDYFYPTNIMITGRDILYLWIVRMIYSGVEYLDDKPEADKIPYYTVYVHPTVQNFEGKRMSKSLGTGIDPMELIDKYGTDATRFGLCGMATATQDVRLQETREPGWSVDAPEIGRAFPTFVQGRNFATKIFNASRFALMNMNEKTEAKATPATLADRWILSRLADTVKTVNDDLDNYRLDQATIRLYEFFWNELCDWYLELAKPAMRDEAIADATRNTLAFVLENALRLMHPFMPFISEEIWQQLPHAAGAAESIMISAYPMPSDFTVDDAVEKEMQLVMDVIVAARKMRAEQGLTPGQKADIIIAVENEQAVKLLNENMSAITTLGRADKVAITNTADASGEHIFWNELPLIINITRELTEEEKTRELEKAKKEHAKLASDIEKTEARLNNPAFAERAPAEVVAKTRGEVAEAKMRQAALADRIAALS